MKKGIIFCLFIALFVFTSCSMTSQLALMQDGKASNSVTVSFGDFLKDMIDDLASWGDMGVDVPAVSPEDISKNISKSDSVKDFVFNKISDNDFSFSYSVEDFNKLIDELAGVNQSLFTVKKTDSSSKFEFNLSFKNYEELEKLIPMLGDENFAIYGPKYNQDISKEDFLIMMDFILEGVGEQMEKSNFSFVITLPSPVISTNAEILDEQTVKFSFSMLDFMLLHEPIHYWVEF